MKKLVLITGVSRGLGFAIAEHLHEIGYEVIGISRTIPKKNVCTHYACDLNNQDELVKTLNLINNNHNNILFIINNAGLSLPQPFEEVTIESLDEVINVNLKTSIIISQFFLKNMKTNNFGRIVNLSSVAINGLSGRSSYSAVKSAVGLVLRIDT